MSEDEKKYEKVRCRKCDSHDWQTSERFDIISCGECSWTPRKKRREEILKHE